MDYNPLDNKPKIRFDKWDWFILIVCALSVLMLALQIGRWIA